MITFEEVGKHVYETERRKDGKIVESHPFNNPDYKGAKILIMGNNS